MRLTKKLATDATIAGFLPEATSSRGPPCTPRRLLRRSRPKEERDVDVHARADEPLDRGNAFGRRGDLDHQVVATDGFEEAEAFFDRFGRIVGEVRRDLDADETVGSARSLVDGTQHVGGPLNVFDDEKIERLGCARSAANRRPERRRVIGAARDRFLEDCGLLVTPASPSSSTRRASVPLRSCRVE